jgi:enoyl-CoA hydratase/carnithine racemase
MDRIPLDTEKRVAEDGPIGWLRFDAPAHRNALSTRCRRPCRMAFDAILDERAPVFRGR